MGNGKRLHEVLKERNYAISKLSEDTGISSNTLYAIIKRDSNINTETLHKIANALNMPIDELHKLLSPEDIKEKKPNRYSINPSVTEAITDIQELINHLNELTHLYNKRLEQMLIMQEEFANITKQIDFMKERKMKMQNEMTVLENEIKNIEVELMIVRNKIK